MLVVDNVQPVKLESQGSVGRGRGRGRGAPPPGNQHMLTGRVALIFMLEHVDWTLKMLMMICFFVTCPQWALP
jgi:hypothetical protein